MFFISENKSRFQIFYTSECKFMLWSLGAKSPFLRSRRRITSIINLMTWTALKDGLPSTAMRVSGFKLQQTPLSFGNASSFREEETHRNPSMWKSFDCFIRQMEMSGNMLRMGKFSSEIRIQTQRSNIDSGIFIRKCSELFQFHGTTIYRWDSMQFIRNDSKLNI